MMSESLKERVSIKNFEKQMSDRELSDNVEKTKVLKIERNNDKIILTLECDRQLLSLLYSYSIGRIDYMDTVKKIKLTLKVG